MLLQRLKRWRRAHAWLHHSDDPFAEAFVGHTDDHCVEHFGVALERVLYLFGEDLLATRVDAHRTAAEQGDGAVGFETSEVAGDYVTLAVGSDDKRGRGLFWILVVANGQVATAGEATNLTSAGRDGLEVVVEHNRVFHRSNCWAALDCGALCNHADAVCAALA